MGELNLERSNVKFDLWERKLLDLSTRNSLLNLRIKGTSIPLFVPDCAKIEDRRLYSAGEELLDHFERR